MLETFQVVKKPPRPPTRPSLALPPLTLHGRCRSPSVRLRFKPREPLEAASGLSSSDLTVLRWEPARAHQVTCLPSPSDVSHTTTSATQEDTKLQPSLLGSSFPFALSPLHFSVLPWKGQQTRAPGSSWRPTGSQLVSFPRRGKAKLRVDRVNVLLLGDPFIEEPPQASGLRMLIQAHPAGLHLDGSKARGTCPCRGLNINQHKIVKTHAKTGENSVEVLFSQPG